MTCPSNASYPLYRALKHPLYPKLRKIDRIDEHVDIAQQATLNPAIVTHDPEMIAATRAFASVQGIATDRYEFQVLYGVRRERERPNGRRAS